MNFTASWSWLHHFANDGEHHPLLLDAIAHRYQAALSDAAGLGPGVRGNEPRQAIERVRAFLVNDLQSVVTSYIQENPA